MQKNVVVFVWSFCLFLFAFDPLDFLFKHLLDGQLQSKGIENIINFIVFKNPLFNC